MAEETTVQNIQGASVAPEPEIFTIPDEFYGAVVRRVVSPSAVPKSSFQPSAVSAPAPFGAPTVARPKPLAQNGEVKSGKWIIIGLAIFLVLAIAGITYYYVHQAQVAKEKIQIPAVIVNTTPLVNPVPIVETSPVAEGVVTTTPEVIMPPTSPEAIFPSRNFSLTADADKDGLTDAEEILFGTDVNKPDTDADGFLDSLEVESLFNPLGYKPVRLIDSGKIKIYLNPTSKYSIYYPFVWVAQSLDANNGTVLFSSDTGEFVEVTEVDNTLKMPVLDWYLAQSPGVVATDLKTVTTKEKIQGAMSPDGLTAYLPAEDKIFVINYNIGLKTEINFLKTFQMMVNSFKVAGDLESLKIEEMVATSTEPIVTSTKN